ncbi:hypothetical protein M885DRAFT_553056 [Pelagophyceae sp. CCMP2097]|nr:hypothetical protein M885DRAFT_553056 [Pelagophyceae sp. CCMP2097]
MPATLRTLASWLATRQRSRRRGPRRRAPTARGPRSASARRPSVSARALRCGGPTRPSASARALRSAHCAAAATSRARDASLAAAVRRLRWSCRPAEVTGLKTQVRKSGSVVPCHSRASLAPCATYVIMCSHERQRPALRQPMPSTRERPTHCAAERRTEWDEPPSKPMKMRRMWLMFLWYVPMVTSPKIGPDLMPEEFSQVSSHLTGQNRESR